VRGDIKYNTTPVDVKFPHSSMWWVTLSEHLPDESYRIFPDVDQTPQGSGWFVQLRSRIWELRK